MTNCPEGRILQEWLDGRLPASQSRGLEAHAAQCASCRKEIERYRAWKSRFKALAVSSTSSPCLPMEMMSAVTAGTLGDAERAKALEHLSACHRCREEWIEVRDLLDAAPKTSPAATATPRRPAPRVVRRSSPVGWIAAAAVLAVALLGLLMFSGDGPSPKTPGVVSQPPEPEEKPPAPQTPRPEVPRPEPPAPLPEAPKPAPETPKPSVKPPERPPAPKPQPFPPTPKPDTPKPQKPVPPKPSAPPSKTRTLVRGTLRALTGAPQTQIRGESGWKRIRTTLTRDFTGEISVRADLAGAKFSAGAHTVYLRRRAELALVLEEGAVRVRLTRGEAFFDVAPGRDAFMVETASGNVVVKGTRFLVAANGDRAEIVVEEGKVEAVSDRGSAEITVGLRGTIDAAKPPETKKETDLGSRLKWVRALDEFLSIEAERFARGAAMAVVADRSASRGAAIETKGHNVPAKDAMAQIRVRRKQSSPYAVWVRLHWGHVGNSGLSVLIHDAPAWSARNVPVRPAWQWARVGTYDLPGSGFLIKLLDPQGGTRIDRILLTSDLGFIPLN